MLKLLALSEADGWAYVQTDEAVQLVRPPYIKSMLVSVDEKSIAKAVMSHGFVHLEKTFENWSDLISFINKKVASFRESLGETITQAGLQERLLELAPKDVLERFLTRVEEELIPRQAWSEAKHFLGSVLKLPLVREDMELFKKATDLLLGIEETEENALTARQDLLNQEEEFASVFSHAYARYGLKSIIGISSQICERGQILAFG